MEWLDETIQQLRDLWAEGYSTLEIGHRLGVTKNAIVGKAHRLDLPARPSPIRRDPDATSTRRAVVERVEGPTLPPLASEEGRVVTPPAPYYTVSVGGQVSGPALPRKGLLGAPKTSRPPQSKPAAPPPCGRVVNCCWPLGEPGTRDFRYCDVPSEPGRPYCEDHVKVAYVKVRDRREDAA